MDNEELFTEVIDLVDKLEAEADKESLQAEIKKLQEELKEAKDDETKAKVTKKLKELKDKLAGYSKATEGETSIGDVFALLQEMVGKLDIIAEAVNKPAEEEEEDKEPNEYEEICAVLVQKATEILDAKLAEEEDETAKASVEEQKAKLAEKDGLAELLLSILTAPVVDVQAAVVEPNEVDEAIKSLRVENTKLNKALEDSQVVIQETKTQMADLQGEKIATARLAELKDSGLVFGELEIKEFDKLKTMSDEEYADYKALLTEVIKSASASTKTLSEKEEIHVAEAEQKDSIDSELDVLFDKKEVE